jgi:uncharacterized membrane protein
MLPRRRPFFAGRVDASARVDSEPSVTEEQTQAPAFPRERPTYRGGLLDRPPSRPPPLWRSISFFQGLFFAYLVVMLAFFVFYVPPFQKADEPAHYFRAVSITNFDFVCSKDETGSFYEMKRRDSDFPDLMHVWDLYIFRDAKFNRDWLDVDWSDPRLDEQGRIYRYCDLPAPGYLPASLGVLIGKPLENPLPGFYLARALGAVFFVPAVILALKLTPSPYRPLLYLYAGLPVVLHQVSAISYDQVHLALYPLIFAFITRFAVEDRLMRRAELLAFAGLLIWSANVRLLSFTPVLLLFLAIRPANVASSTKEYLRSASVFAVAGIAFMLVHALLYLPGSAEIDNDAKPWDQLDFVISHPGDFLAASYETLRDGEWLMKQFMAVFGWLEYGPSYFIFFAIVFVAGIVIYRIFETDQPRLEWPQIGGILGAVALTVVSLFVSLYLVWNSVGSDIVDGLQGRYFVGLVPIAVFGVSQLASRVGKLRFLQAGLVVATVILVYNVVRTVDLRYYG